MITPARLPNSREYQKLKWSPAVAPWLKESYVLAEVPARLGEPRRGQFVQALSWAGEGLWESAAAAFELLSADPAACPAADRNLGLCRLWLGDHESAARALRRSIERGPATTEAVDLALVCQIIDPAVDKEPIEQVQLTWPVRDREGLLRILASETSVVEGGPRRLDPDDEKSPELESFHWLDRPAVEARSGLQRAEIPHIQADLLIGPDTVVLETFDDGQLNSLIDRFTGLAGRTVPPAHPRTKVIDQVDRSQHALSWMWYVPPGLADAERQRLDREQLAYLATQVWPATPMADLGGRSPRQFAGAGNSEVVLRAAVLGLEFSGTDWGGLVDWQAFRAGLGLTPEPLIDPQRVDIDQVAVGRLDMIPESQLDDHRLVRLYERAEEYGLNSLTVRAAQQIVRRPELESSGKIERLHLYSTLSADAAVHQDRAAAMEWLRRGREGELAGRRAALALQWDLLELDIRIAVDPIEEWVPELAILLERVHNDEQASNLLTTRLLQMGLIRVVSPPDRPGEVMLDSRPLQQLLSTYGPRVTTGSGYLGVSATRGEIWTPESETRGSAIWTPGSGTPAAGAEKPRILLP